MYLNSSKLVLESRVVLYVSCVKVAGLMQLRLTLAEKLQRTVNHLTSLQARVLDEELISWKRDQQLAGNGSQFNTTLDNIQEW